MYLMVQVILVLFVRTEPAVILLCAAILSVPELSEVKLGKYRNGKTQRKCCRKLYRGLSQLQLSGLVCCVY